MNPEYLAGFKPVCLAPTKWDFAPLFHKSDTSLKLWFYAIFLFANSKNGVSGKELQRQLGVTYKTAWRMAKQIRLLFKKTGPKLSNTVEMDETYVGGRRKGRAQGKTGRGADGKSVVFGIVERKGQVLAKVVPNIAKTTIYPIIQDTVEKGSKLMTDTYRIYHQVSKMDYGHEKIRHGEKEYVRGNVHTNTIEGFWSQLKRSIDGTYHSVSPKYLQSYVDEFSYRYNLRHAEPSSFFPSMLSEVSRQVL